MNQEIKQKWLKALRSGKYKQGRRILRNKQNEFCCLGVLCDIVNVEWVEDEELFRASYKSSISGGYLVYGLAKDLDIYWGSEHRLMNMNDAEDRSFVEIADWIERNL